MTSPFRLRRRAPVGVAWPEPATMAWAALGALLALGAIFLFRETRGTTFNLDEWSWITQRRGSGLGTFLDPHNSHLSLVPVALYKLLFATAGLGDYVPYRVIGIVAHLAVAALVFVYARRRVGDFLALVGAGLMLLLFATGYARGRPEPREHAPTQVAPTAKNSGVAARTVG